MRWKTKLVIMWTSILSLFGCDQTETNNKVNNKPDQTIKPEQYVSMECQTGDITLTLNPDKNFDLTILFWDNKTKQHTGQKSLNGNWTKTHKFLTLITQDNNKVVYELTKTYMKIGDHEVNSTTYAFKSNEKDFFGTHFNLLEKEQTDYFLTTATEQK